MSVSSSRKLARGNTRKAVDYELFGALGSKKFKAHQANGTNRVAAIRCDLDSPEDYVARAEAMAEATGRRIEAKSLIQSFENVEMDPSNPLDVETVSDLGYEFAKRLHPNSDVLVITHTDGAGGHPHNHIKILNHDNVSGKAIRGNDMYFQFFAVNDALMTERGLSVAERGSRGRAKDQAQYWEHQRDASGMSAFDTWLGDTVHECLVDMAPKDQAEFVQNLSRHGVELVESEHTIKASADGTQPEHVAVGWTYRATDEFGPKRRTRRRAASSLSEEFTKARAEKTFEANRQQAAALAAAPAAPVVAAPARPVILAPERFMGTTTYEPDVLAMGRAGYTLDEIDAATTAWEEQEAARAERDATQADARDDGPAGGDDQHDPQARETREEPVAAAPVVVQEQAAVPVVEAPEPEQGAGSVDWADDADGVAAAQERMLAEYRAVDEAMDAEEREAAAEQVADGPAAAQAESEAAVPHEREADLAGLDEKLAELDQFDRTMAAKGGNAAAVRAGQIASERQQLERARLRITNPGLAAQLDRADDMNAGLDGQEESRGIAG